jgi:hypothetical protein
MPGVGGSRRIVAPPLENLSGPGKRESSGMLLYLLLDLGSLHDGPGTF